MWTAKDVSNGPARGNFPLNVYGENLDRTNRAYQCVFHAHNYSFEGLTSFSDDDLAQSSQADVLDNNTLNCIVPLWASAAGSYVFSVFLDGVGVIPFSGSQSTEQIFNFSSGWDTVSGDSPTAGAASGGAVLTFWGYGFDPEASSFACVFERAGETLSSAAQASSSRELSCTTPAWGRQYFGASADRRDSLGIYSNVTIYLLNGNEEVMWLAASSGREFGTSCQGAECARFLFFSVWAGIALNQTSSPYGASVAGGEEMTVAGYAFAMSATYYCELRSSADEVAYTAAQTPSSPSSIRFTAPPWTTPATNVIVTLYLSNNIGVADPANDSLVTYSLSYPSNLTYDEAWNAVQPTAGLAQGGAQVWVSMSGLLPASVNRSYGCRFSTNQALDNCSVWAEAAGSTCIDGAIFLVSEAQVVSATTIGCLTPEWELPAASSAFALVRRFNEEDAWHEVFKTGAAARYDFLEEWHALSGRSDGGTRLAVEASGGSIVNVSGHGFDDTGASQYLCTLRSVDDAAEAITRVAVVLDPTTMQCEVPPWGLQFGEAVVQLRVWHVGVGAVQLSLQGSPLQTANVSCASARCTLRLFSVWHRFTPSSGCATGGKGVVVFGAGFDSRFSNGTTGYRCVWSDGNTTVSSPAQAINSTALQCTTQPWASPILATSFSLANAVLVSDSNETMQYTFEACWASKNVSTARARGGKLIGVSGAGFADTVGTFACRFEADAVAAESAVAIVSTQELVCSAPEWVAGAALVNFSLVANSSTVLFDGADSSALSFLFTPGWTSLHPTTGLASGNTSVTVQGYGFSNEQAFFCNFSRAASTTLTTAAMWLADSLLSCPTPEWGAANAAGARAGAATFSLFTGGSKVDLAPHGELAVAEGLCAAGAVQGNCSFLFAPLFRPASIRPYAHAAAGGSLVSFTGLGLDSSAAYVCLFEYDAADVYVANASVLVSSTTRGECEVPAWNFRATSNVTLRLVIGGSYLAEEGERIDLLTITAGYESITPTLGTAKGGDRVTVSGFGFDSALDPVCYFDGLASQVGLVMSTTEIQCTVPAWYADARATNFSLSLGAFNLSAVAPNATARGTLYPGRRPLTFEYFPEWTRHGPGLADRLGGSNGGRSVSITVIGFGFDTTQLYRCRYAMADRFAHRSAQSDAAYAVQPTMLVFEPPEWDLVTPSLQYVTNLTNISVEELGEDGSWRLVSTTNGSTVEPALPLRIEQINKIPAFDFVSQNISVQAQSTPYSFTIAENVFAGVTHLGAAVPSEADQTVTFHLSRVSAAMFSSGPTLHADGRMEFTVAENQFGTLHLYVYIADDGGTAHRGVDRTEPQLLHLTVVPTRSIPTFTLSTEHLAVAENSPAYTAVGLVSSVSTGPNVEFLQTVTFSVVHDAYFFSAAPRVGTDGNLEFTLADYAYGTTTLQIVLTSMSGTNSSSSFMQELELEVLQVNQRPSFSINASFREVVVYEDQYGATSPFVLPNFVVDIKGGANVSDGAGGEDWDESEQALSFIVIGGSAVFAVKPEVDSSGTLTFTLAESENGLTYFSLILRDDGANFNGGRDTSSAGSFSIRVLGVNDQPFFMLDCPVENWFLSCGAACDGSDLDRCAVQVDVWENCEDCEPRNWGYQNCSRSFVAYRFATNIRPSVLSKENERNQSLSFVVQPNQNSSFLFAPTDRTEQLMPVIDAATGTLFFCLAQGQNGNVSFNVSLMDDGGIRMGGVDTLGSFLLRLLVLPVNQQPSFQLCCGITLHVWMDSRSTSIDSFVTDILKGNRNDNGDDVEATASALDFAQSLTFVLLNDVPAAFVHQPHITVNGTLSFTIVDGFSGSVEVNITLVDDGGTARGGINVSEMVNFTLVVSESYLLVTVDDTVAAQEVTAGISSALMVERRMVLVQSHTEYLVVSTSLPETLRAARVASNLTAMGPWAPASGSLVVSTQAVLRNYANVGNFSVVNSTVLLTGVLDDPLVQRGFITDIVAPPHTPVDLDGRHVVEFEVVPLRYKAYAEAASWVSDGSGGGVIESGPNVTAVCEPACTTAVLSAAQGAEAVNGFVEYEVRMARSNRSEGFVVDAQLVFGVDEEYAVLEDQHIASVGCFVALQYAGMEVTMDPIPSVEVSLHPFSLATMSLEPFAGSPASTLLSIHPTLSLNTSGCVALSAELIPDAFGTAWFVINASQPSHGTLFNVQRTFQFTVLSVNDQPSFAFRCSDDVFAIECLNCTGLSGDGCIVKVTVNRQNVAPQMMVSDPARHCEDAYTVANFSQNISSSALSLFNEQNQSLTFIVQPNEPNASSLFVEGFLPSIDPRSGDLSFCLALDQDGNTTFTVWLVDDGGRDRGGEDTIGPFQMTIIVVPVNQQPSFQLCCGQTLHVWMDSRSTSIDSFVTDILKGNLHRDGYEIEEAQTISFTVINDVPAAFVHQPHITVNGTLSFTIVDGFSGSVEVNITLVDDGGTARGGINVSEMVNFTLVVSESYLLVTVDDTVAAQEVTAGISSALMVERRMVLVQSHTEYLVVSTSLPETLRAARVASNLTAMGPWAPASGSLVVSTQAVLRNYANVGNFSVVNSTVLLTGVLDAPLVQRGFITDIVAPPHTPVDLDGRHVVEFEVVPLRYKAYAEAASWVSDGSGGGVIESGPNVTAVCEPACTTAVLSAAQGAEAVNGFVEFEVRMARSNRSEGFVVDAQLVLYLDSVVQLLEDQENSTVSCFVTSTYAAAVQNASFVSSSFVGNPAVPGNTTVLMAAPSFVFRYVGCWDLHIPLLQYQNGNESFVITVISFGGRHSIDLDIRIEVIPVNNAPSFDIPAVVLAPENLDEDVAYSFSNAILDVASGPENEDGQLLTFIIAFVSGDRGLLVSPPHIAPDGRLNFTVSQFERGAANYEVTLVDDGGTKFWGANTSMPQTLTVEVQPANHPPFFEIADNTSTFLETDAPFALHHPGFATNITPGVLGATTNLSEADQEITFSVAQIGGNPLLFWHPPNVSDDGTLSVVLTPHQYGSAQMVVQLQDDGGTLGEGLDTSNPQNFTIVVEPVNDPPQFVIADAEAVAYEQLDNSVQRLGRVASEISPGPLEPEQSVTFLAVIHAFRVPDIAGEPWSSAIGDLFGEDANRTQQQLFAANSNVSMSSNGTLSFITEPLRNGIVNLSVVAVDDGGTAFGGRNASEPQFVLLRVTPVNSQPTFDLPNPFVSLLEDGSLEIPAFATNISHGGWEERDQMLHFTLEIVDGPGVLFDILQIECEETGFYSCSGENATLSLHTLPDHFGTVLLNVSLLDDGGTAFGGVDSSTLQMVVEVRAVNDIPEFGLVAPLLTVAEDTGCFMLRDSSAIWTDFLARPSDYECEQSTPLHWSFSRFALVESLGPLEDGPDACPSLTECEDQASVFEVACEPGWPNLLAALPNVTATGALFMQLLPQVSGKIGCWVWMEDRGALDGSVLSTPTQNFSIEVMPVNDAPSFDASDRLTVCEDSGPVAFAVALNITRDGGGGTEPSQNLTFNTFFVDSEGLFAEGGSPTLSLDGVLSFETARDMFGEVTLFVQLTDSGGSELGGQDRSRTQEVSIVIQPVNDPPSFETQDLLLHEDLGAASGQVAVDASLGSANEGCEQATLFCQAQTFTYRILDLSQPDLFFVFPNINASGSMSFELAPDASGVSIVTVQLVDDGGTDNTCETEAAPNATQTSPPGDNSSAVHTFAVAVEAVNDLPDFRLQWNVTCLTGNASCMCDTESDSLGGPSCVSVLDPESMELPSPYITILNTIDGDARIDNFATYITPAQGYLPETRLEHDSASGRTSFVDVGSDSVFNTPGLEYATDFVISPDRRHLYAIEADRDSMLTVGWSDDTNSVSSYIDRNSDGEDRLRFLPFENEDSPRDVQGTRGVCGLEVFEHEGSTMMVAASGCDSLLERHIPRPEGVCGDAEGKACGIDCCESLWADTVGLWMLNSASTVGRTAVNDIGEGELVECSDSSCAYSRPKNQEACAEEFAVHIDPATFRDEAGVLGGAIVMPPACKTGSAIDWDREESSFSANSFLANDGQAEATQFDGAINSGLIISKNIASLVDGTVENSKLPLEELTAEVWFRVSKADVERAGLVAAQQDGQQCGKGWSLTYSMVPPAGNRQSSTTFSLSVSLEGNNFFDYGTLITVSHTITPGLRIGQWAQVVGTYDKTRLSIYVDGQLGQELVACLFPPCGKIVYPAPYHPEGSCTLDGTVFGIGSYVNVRNLQSFPHVGAIRLVRIMKRALRANETAALYQDDRHAVRETTEPDGDYWTRAVGGGVQWSPSQDLTSAGQRESVQMRGRFLRAAPYRFRVTSFEDSAVSHDCLVSTVPADGISEAAYGNMLTCVTPIWTFGYRAATIALERNISSAAEGSAWQRLIQKVCLSDECGFVPWETRTVADWWSSGYRLTIRGGLSGALTLYRFTTETLLLRFDREAAEMEPLSSFAAVTDCSGRVCVFGQGACDSGEAAGVPCRSDEDCGGAPCSKLSNFNLLGAASVTAFSVNSTRYLLAANFWDGANVDTTSSLFRLNGSEVLFVQHIPTRGARRWEILQVGSTTFAVVANLVGASFAYPWTSSAQPLNTTEGIPLNVAGASGLTSFTIGSSAFLAVPTFSGTDPAVAPLTSKVFQFDSVVDGQVVDGQEIFETDGGRIVVKEYELESGSVLGVQHMVLDGVDYLAFAAAGSAPSPVFRIGMTGSSLDWTLVQRIATEHATSLHHFYSRSHFLVISQPRADSAMYRWNGTAFFREPNQLTLPKDSAGGQVLPYSSIEAATTFKIPGTAGDAPREFMVLGLFGSAGAAVAPSLLLRAKQLVVSGFVNPVSIKITADGRHIYVAASMARGILGFVRDNSTGLLQLNASAGYLTNWTRTLMANQVPDNTAVDKLRRGFPLRGITQLAISPDQNNVYAASMLDNTVTVFERDTHTGQLHLRQTLEYSPTIEFSGLDGAKGVSVSKDGGMVYVAGWRDQAVSMWARDEEGRLTFVDKLRNGERLPHTFRHDVGRVPAREYGESAQVSPSGLPFRIGTDAAMSVKAALHARIEGRHYWIMAEMQAGAETGIGRVAVYAWEPSDSSVQLLNFSTIDETPCCLAHFEDVEAGVVAHYLVVANAPTVQAPAVRTNVYRWDSVATAFVWQHALPLPSDLHSAHLYASALRPFKIGDRRFLAVSNLRDEGGFFVPSVLYEFERLPAERTVAGVVDLWKRGEFKQFQLLPTQKGVDIEIAEFDGHTLLMLAHGPVAGRNPQPGRVDMYAFDDPQDKFVLLQTISSPGINDVEPFQLPNLGLFVALANRQVLPLEPGEAGDLTVYDIPSLLLRFDPDAKQFYHWQTMQGAFRTVVQDDAVPYEQNRFCGDRCDVADDGVTRFVSGLRGATSFKSFVADGETYLAVAQSVCSLDDAPGRCEWAQPKSAVLQWNRVALEFGEMLALSDRDSMRLYRREVPDHDIDFHSFALRIDGGFALGWHFLEAAGRQLLLQYSLTHGAVLREWEFRKVGAMQGPVSAASDAADGVVFVASDVSAAVAVLRRRTLFDHVGSAKALCAAVGCLEFKTALGDEAQLLGAWDVSRARPVKGLGGARELVTSEAICEAGPCTRITVFGRLPRDELRCGVVPPIGVSSSAERASAACQDVRFSLDVADTQFPLLFVGGTPPAISADGSLVFGVLRGRVGTATYNVRIHDSGGGEGRFVSQVRFDVRGFNQAPFFTSFDILTNERTLDHDGANMTFAAGVSAGLNEEYQDLIWVYTFDASPGMFGAYRPLLGVLWRADGSRDGVLRLPAFATLRPGVATFNITLMDDGGSNEASGDINLSPPSSFRVTVRAVNRQPSFELRLSSLLVEEGRGPLVVDSFAVNMSTNDEDRALQSFAFGLSSVLAMPGAVEDPDSASLFELFELAPNGTLRLQTSRGWSGFFMVTVLMQDSGGTAGGGVDSIERAFALQVVAASQVPSFTAPPLIELVEATSDSEKSQFFPGLLRVISPDVSANPDLTLVFRVIDISNPQLYQELPSATSDGNLSFVLTVGASGVSELRVLLEVQGNFSSAAPRTSQVSAITIFVGALNVAPFFTILPLVKLVQSDEPVSISNYADNITSGRQSEVEQRLSFEVSYAAPTNFFRTAPTLLLDGTLQLTLHPEALLTATIYVTLVDDGGVAYGGVDRFARIGIIQVLEKPTLSSVFPAMLPLHGGTLLTLTGKFQGTLDVPTSLSVSVGSQLCSHVRQLSDAEIRCRAPPGLMGRQGVEVTLTEGSQLRRGSWDGALLYAHLLLGGASLDGSAGFIAAGPGGPAHARLDAPGSSLVDTGVDIGRGVSSLQWLDGVLYAGGGFEDAGGGRVGYVMSWDSARVRRLGRGVDGAIEGMCVFEGKLVVAGSFNRAFNSGANVVASGGVAVWDGSGWDSLGGRLRGTVTAVSCGEGGVVVGGRIERVEQQRVNGMAKFDATTRRWGAVGNAGADGVRGGEVLAVLQQGEDLLIGGSFSSAGGVRALRMAVFRSNIFEALGEFDGAVRCFAASGDTVFVGGDFTSIDGRPFDRIAILRGARFESLRPAVTRGSVQSLLFTMSCLYAGGGFPGYAARWCKQEGTVEALDSDSAAPWVMEPLEGFEGFGPVQALQVAFQ